MMPQMLVPLSEKELIIIGPCLAIIYTDSTGIRSSGTDSNCTGTDVRTQGGGMYVNVNFLH